MILQTSLIAAGCLQLAAAVLNMRLVNMLNWQGPLATLPLLPRQVFHVHLWFISITLAGFSTLTLAFHQEMAAGSNAVAAALAAFIGLFWTVRTVIQILYYSSSHWRGHRRKSVVHVLLLATYTAMSAAYFIAAAKGLST